MRNRELQFPFLQEIISQERPGERGADGGQADGKKRNREEDEGGKKTKNIVFLAAAVSETLLYYTHTPAHTQTA